MTGCSKTGNIAPFHHLDKLNFIFHLNHKWGSVFFFFLALHRTPDQMFSKISFGVCLHYCCPFTHAAHLCLSPFSLSLFPSCSLSFVLFFSMFIVATVALGKRSYYNQWPGMFFLDPNNNQPITLTHVTSEPNLGLGNIAKTCLLSLDASLPFCYCIHPSVCQ